MRVKLAPRAAFRQDRDMSRLSPLAPAWKFARRSLRAGLRLVWRLALLGALLGLLGDGAAADRSLRARTIALARPLLYDYVSWEVDALWEKAHQELFGAQAYLDEAAQRPLIAAYLDDLSRAQDLDDTIQRAYAYAVASDPAQTTAALRAERDALRASLAARQPLVESLLEGQVSAVLAEEGFETLGQVLPPVAMHFTALPMLLAVSPRDRIELVVDLNVNPLSVAESAALEARVDQTLGVASLVAPLGGISLYPSMVVEPAARDLPAKLARAIEVTAHEWVHHYLTFYPLGLEYTARAETRILNETTATFFGREIAQRVMARYYPDLPAPVYPSFLHPAPTVAPPPDQPPFNFEQALAATRTRVDELLAAGRVEEAEAYMEAQRRGFVAHGYAIRKLNQAYFAFYGGYQGETGAGGEDPTGRAVEELRALSPDVRAWLRTLRGVTTRAELLAALDAAQKPLARVG